MRSVPGGKARLSGRHVWKTQTFPSLFKAKASSQTLVVVLLSQILRADSRILDLQAQCSEPEEP